MIPELGHISLIFALVVSVLCGCTPLLHTRIKGIVRIIPAMAFIQMMLITLAFAALIYCYATSDFSVLNVVLNSHSDKPFLFKITGAWGNHEGSMLLWVWVLAAYGMCIAFKHSTDEDLQQKTLVVHGWVMAGFIAFILFTSNPFLRALPPALQGQDLNPLLQDIGLAMHPPMLYAGYVGFGIVFSYAIAALWRGKIDAAWARETQPWILMAWSTLTLGIGLGSWWAYRELGWGGWWFWDPVENVSLLPWFAGTALLHSNLVLERKNMLGGWVLLLAIACFTMSLIGTFIVRSGLIMSVHSFTSDPLRGSIILLYIGCVVGGALLLYAIRRVGSPPSPLSLFSRTGGILLNNMLLLTLMVTILLSILAPMVLGILQLPTITVGAPYFNTIFFPLAAPLVLLAGLGPLLPWNHITSQQWWQRVSPLMMFAAAAALLVFMVAERGVLLGMIAAALTGWLISATLWQVVRRYRAIPALPSDIMVKRLLRFPLQQAGTLLSHAGLAVLCGAIAWSSLGRERYEATLPSSGVLNFGQYQLQLLEATKEQKDNYTARSAHFRITEDGSPLSTLSPEIRYYPAREMETSEVAIDSGLLRDIYIVIGHQAATDDTPQRIGVRLYITPAMSLLWAGFVMIAGGGIISLFARLYGRARIV